MEPFAPKWNGTRVSLTIPKETDTEIPVKYSYNKDKDIISIEEGALVWQGKNADKDEDK